MGFLTCYKTWPLQVPYPQYCESQLRSSPLILEPLPYPSSRCYPGEHPQLHIPTSCRFPLILKAIWPSPLSLPTLDPETCLILLSPAPEVLCPPVQPRHHFCVPRLPGPGSCGKLPLQLHCLLGLVPDSIGAQRPEVSARALRSEQHSSNPVNPRACRVQMDPAAPPACSP